MDIPETIVVVAHDFNKKDMALRYHDTVAEIAGLDCAGGGGGDKASINIYYTTEHENEVSIKDGFYPTAIYTVDVSNDFNEFVAFPYTVTVQETYDP